MIAMFPIQHLRVLSSLSPFYVSIFSNVGNLTIIFDVFTYLLNIISCPTTSVFSVCRLHASSFGPRVLAHISVVFHYRKARKIEKKDGGEGKMR